VQVSLGSGEEFPLQLDLLKVRGRVEAYVRDAQGSIVEELLDPFVDRISQEAERKRRYSAAESATVSKRFAAAAPLQSTSLCELSDIPEQMFEPWEMDGEDEQ
jgi:hypothetical protein